MEASNIYNILSTQSPLMLQLDEMNIMKVL